MYKYFFNGIYRLRTTRLECARIIFNTIKGLPQEQKQQPFCAIYDSTGDGEGDVSISVSRTDAYERNACTVYTAARLGYATVKGGTRSPPRRARGRFHRPLAIEFNYISQILHKHSCLLL